MRGFFESDYLSFKKAHLSSLVALANADGNVHEKELKLLYKIGRKYGLKTRHIDSVIAQKDKYELKTPEDHKRRLDQMYDLVALMMADGVIEPQELEFCEDIARKFGFQKGLVQTLIEVIKARGADDEYWDNFKEEFESGDPRSDANKR